jgi:3-dehydroquinate synthetase
VNKKMLSRSTSERINSFIERYYKSPTWLVEKKNELLEFVKKDKKNREGIIRMVLLEEIGSALLDVNVSDDEIISAMN